MAKLDPTLMTFEELLRYADRTNPWIDELIKGFEEERADWELKELELKKDIEDIDQEYRYLQYQYERE